MLIPYLLSTPPASKRPGRPAYKPSRSEIREGFVTLVATDLDIVPTVQARHDRYAELGLTYQPFVVCVGTSILDVRRSCVVVNDTFYNLNGGIEGVDAAFKIFCVTGTSYPVVVRDVWLFVQRFFYGISTKFDRVTQSIRHLAADLNLDCDS